jgi:uroporphyrin-III C-methyltransferase
MALTMSISAQFRKVMGFLGGNSDKHILSPVNNVAEQENQYSRQGKVYLIGAGPGDPELLTVKAHRLIQQADVILIDWLVGEALYPLFPKNAERIFVGKKCGRHSMSQQDINALMVEKAQTGATVVRLKGGDPSVFGRLAEETDTLSAHDIPFAVIPGVTAASGVAAYSGIPLTHRECAQSVKFVTAHVKNGGVAANWQQLAQDPSTLVFYMGLNRVGQIQQALTENGMRSDMPLAVIDQGTTAAQKVVSGTLSDFDAKPKLADFAGPALIIVGEVVNHRQNVDLSLVASEVIEAK